jgi:flagellar biogenesis protein FliO
MALDAGQLGTAFCTGGLFTILLLLVWGAYLLLKAGVRWFLRQRGEPPVT